MYEIDYSLSWILETIYSAITYFEWICLVCTFRSGDAWFVSEMHTAV